MNIYKIFYGIFIEFLFLKNNFYLRDWIILKIKIICSEYNQLNYTRKIKLFIEYMIVMKIILYSSITCYIIFNWYSSFFFDEIIFILIFVILGFYFLFCILFFIKDLYLFCFMFCLFHFVLLYGFSFFVFYLLYLFFSSFSLFCNYQFLISLKIYYFKDKN